MGGEWWFSIVKEKDPSSLSSFELQKYQACLLEIRKEYEGKMSQFNFNKFGESYGVEWSPDHVAEETNIFAEFTYICRARHTPHGYKKLGISSATPKPGVKCKSTASWKLYYNPLIVPDDDVDSDVRARCAPTCLIMLSVEIQKILAIKFPKHFQLYLGDGISGAGPAYDQVWGVKLDYECANHDGVGEEWFKFC